MGISDNIKNGIIIGSGLQPVETNAPSQYVGHRHEYFADVSEEFIQRYARYASDFFDAEMQGLDQSNPFNFEPVRLRLSDIVKPSAATIQYADDYKNVLIESKAITYIRAGTKFWIMSNIWLATNPNNISSGDGSGIIRRCNAVWNHFDYFGNIVSEPIIVEKSRASANDNDYQEMGLITKGYFNVRCQYNNNTAQLAQNSRMILGSGAYQITGFSDFIQEFTGDYNSIRMLDFTVRYEEPNLEIDDMENHVAGGKEFSWDIQLSGTPTITAGLTWNTITAKSIRNGLEATPEANPDDYDTYFQYEWTSSDENVLLVGRIDATTAFVVGVSAGTATITCTNNRNPNIFKTFEVSVEEASDAPHVSFNCTVPDTLVAFKNAELKATYYENGVETTQTVNWTLSGAKDGSYSYLINGNEITVNCWGASETPLIVTAECNGYSAMAQIDLEGI